MTTIIINGDEVPAALIGDLPPSPTPTRDYLIAAMSGERTDRLSVGSILALLENAAGINTNSVTVSNAGNAPLGGFGHWEGGEGAAVTAGFPALGGSGSRFWDVVTYGLSNSRRQQIATERNSNRLFVRGIVTGSTYGPWCEMARADAVLLLAGGTVTGPVRFNNNFGLGRAGGAPGVLYVHRSGKPSIILSTGPSETPTTIGRLQADDVAGRFGFTDANGASYSLYINASDSLPYASGNPTQPLGLATKQYVDSAVAAGGGLGINQAWQDVISTRAFGTPYQNTTGKPILVAIRANMSVAGSLEVSQDGVAGWVTAGTMPSNNPQPNAYAIIPPGHYYRAMGTVTNIITWSELR